MPQAAKCAAPYSPVVEPLRFHFVPLLFAAVFFSCGIIAARFVWLIPALLLFGFLVCGIVGVLTACKAQRVSLLAAWSG